MAFIEDKLLTLVVLCIMLLPYAQIRRMKQLEQEKDVLLQGLEVIDRARDWYLKEIASLSDKQTFAEKSSYSVSNNFEVSTIKPSY